MKKIEKKPENMRIPAINVKNTDYFKKNSIIIEENKKKFDENSVISQNSHRNTRIHERKKSNSYHYEPKIIENPLNFYENSRNNAMNYDPNYQWNNSMNNQWNNPLNSSVNPLISGRNPLENERFINEFLMKKRKKKKINEINEENTIFMNKVMKKQSDLIEKLVETRENTKKKKEELYIEDLRNKINKMESNLMFKKFETDQMNFLLDLKHGLLSFSEENTMNLAINSLFFMNIYIQWS